MTGHQFALSYSLVTPKSIKTSVPEKNVIYYKLMFLNGFSYTKEEVANSPVAHYSLLMQSRCPFYVCL